MKLIVFSDSHGRQREMLDAIALHPNAECFLHLGDGAPDFEQICRERGLPHSAVRGNCDFYTDLPYEMVLNFGGFQFYLSHGHLHHAKYSLAELSAAGRSARADVILFGHTHRRLEEYRSEEERPYYLFNPGAIGPAYGDRSSYGVIEIRGKHILLSHAVL